MNKLKTATEMVAELRDGMTIGIGGWGPRRKPMALIREIIRSDLKDLTIVAYGGADVGMLCAAGKVKKLIFAFVSLDFIPLEPFFRKAREQGNLEVMEIDEGMLLLGLRAAAWGCPFIPTQVGLGTDVIKKIAGLKVIDSPYDDKEWVAMPALKLDAALVHVDHADERGVCQISGPDHYMDDWFVRAANKSYITCDELVTSEHFNDPAVAHQVFWERSLTTAVCPIAGGAHPTSCPPFYGIDNKHLLQYNKYAKEGGFSAYSDEFISNKTEQDYQDLVGGIDAIRQIPQTRY